MTQFFCKSSRDDAVFLQVRSESDASCFAQVTAGMTLFLGVSDDRGVEGLISRVGSLPGILLRWRGRGF